MITIIAGVNGAGKSSVAGAYIVKSEGHYHNPDEVARELLQANASLSQDEANSLAWTRGRDQLIRSILEGGHFNMETTLGGDSICRFLHNAIDAGRDVRIIFVGLASPEMHMERVAARVAKGGHDIPEEAIRRRWKTAIQNMMSLIPRCAEVRVIDNSAPVDDTGPHPLVLFALKNGQLTTQFADPMPEWAKPLADAARERVSGKG